MSDVGIRFNTMQICIYIYILNYVSGEFFFLGNGKEGMKEENLSVLNYSEKGNVQNIME